MLSCFAPPVSITDFTPGNLGVLSLALARLRVRASRLLARVADRATADLSRAPDPESAVVLRQWLEGPILNVALTLATFCSPHPEFFKALTVHSLPLAAPGAEAAHSLAGGALRSLVVAAWTQAVVGNVPPLLASGVVAATLDGMHLVKTDQCLAARLHQIALSLALQAQSSGGGDTTTTTTHFPAPVANVLLSRFQERDLEIAFDVQSCAPPPYDYGPERQKQVSACVFCWHAF